MARNQTRNFNPALQRLLVQETDKGPKISDDVQMVYVMGDHSDLLPAIGAVYGYWTENSPSDVARRGVIELQSPPDSAIEVLFWQNNDAANTVGWVILDATRITADLAVHPPDFTNDGQPSRAAARDGTGVVFSLVQTIPVSGVMPRGLRVILPPGRVLIFMTSALNITCNMTLAWRELPAPA